MVLTKEEYEAQKAEFLRLYSNELKDMLLEKREKYLEIELKRKGWKEFVENYTGGVILVFLFFVVAYVKHVISLQLFVTLAFLEIVPFVPVYGRWKKEAESSILTVYSHMTQSIVRDFIWDKMQAELRSISDEEDYEKAVQFYTVALYDIPQKERFIDPFLGYKL